MRKYRIEKIPIFVLINQSMFEFDQYLGFLSFLTILTIGFWLMIFLLTFVIPYWLVGALIEYLKYGRNKETIEKKK
ncbi:hypothetical protein OAQ04_01295 [Flavobacteriaceae bacterium]|nr:hypothetical protein [Flavobacteriaceae bacterium]